MNHNDRWWWVGSFSSSVISSTSFSFSPHSSDESVWQRVLLRTYKNRANSFCSVSVKYEPVSIQCTFNTVSSLFLGGTLWWVLRNLNCLPNLKLLASAVAEILKGNSKILGSSSSHSPGPRPFFSGWDLIWVCKPQLRAKFEVTGLKSVIIWQTEQNTLARFMRHCIYNVFQKKNTYIIGYKLRNSCLVLIIFDTKIPHIIWNRVTA